VESALRQTYPDVEVIIGDDSPDTESLDRVAPLLAQRPRRVEYVKNDPPLGQVDNVNRLFGMARGDRLVLLHDDDVLLPDALQRLNEAWTQDTVIAFGTQQMISADGMLLPDETSILNDTYYRMPRDAHVQSAALESALLQRIPNDGFMVKTVAAQATGYRHESDVGVYCDLDFNLRLTATGQWGRAVFIDSFVSQYRLSEDSISGSIVAHRYEHPRASVVMYEKAESLALPRSLESARKVLLRRLAGKAVKGYALSGRRLRALRIFFSDSYPMSRRLTRRGLYHFALILSPAVERLRRYS